MKCDICSFVVEANNFLVDVCSQLVLIYAPLLGSFHRVDKHQTIKEEEEEEEEVHHPLHLSRSRRSSMKLTMFSVMWMVALSP